MKKIGVIGFGYMGSAIALGLKRRKKDFMVAVSEINPQRVILAKEKYKFEILPNKDLISSTDIMIIAVKPQELDRLFTDIEKYTKDKKIISVVAGKKIKFFSNKLNANQIARFMPNLAASIGKAAVGVSFNQDADEQFKKDCLNIARILGTPYPIAEDLMPAITGISGSGLAYIFSFFHAMALGGVKSGIKYQNALQITLNTIEGAMAICKKSKKNPIDLLCQVISPAGTTIQGIKALEQGGFTSTVIDAVYKANKRAKELESL